MTYRDLQLVIAERLISHPLGWSESPPRRRLLRRVRLTSASRLSLLPRWRVRLVEWLTRPLTPKGD